MIRVSFRRLPPPLLLLLFYMQGSRSWWRAFGAAEMGGCKWPGCQVKAPRYTRKGLKPYRGEYCLKHAKCFYPSRELVNMNLPQCKAPSYCDERAKVGARLLGGGL